MKDAQPLRLHTERLLPWVVLVFLLAYTYATFFRIPYVGFDFNPTNGEVLSVFVPVTPDAELQVGDRLLRLGGLTWAERRADTRRALFEPVDAGQVVLLEVDRQGSRLSFPWKFPGPNLPEFSSRLFNLWFLAYIFWGAGTATLLLLRPKDTRWVLFIAFYYLTAAWLITGNISRWRIWESAVLLRSLIWLSAPVYLHLHWVFPKPLGRIPRPMLIAMYLAGAGLAAAELFQLLPVSAYALGFLVAVFASLAFLLLHYLRQPDQRREVGMVGTAIALALLPSIGIAFARLFSEVTRLSAGGMFAFPLLPGIYFYAVFRRQLGGLEMRANRLISLYLFFILIGSVFVILLAFASARLDDPGVSVTYGVLAALLAGVITSTGYPPFKRVVERRLLGIPHPPDDLLEIYTARITTSLDMPYLVSLLRDEVFPSLLIQQYALLYINDTDQMEPLLTAGVEAQWLPSHAEMIEIQDQAENHRIVSTEDAQQKRLSWVRLALSLRIDERTLGFLLLGRRAPDDFYAQSELPTIQALADQTAIALINIAQAKQLRAYYQANISRYEEERKELARDLHDEILNRLVVLGMSMDNANGTQQFSKAYQELIQHTRQAISSLRPPMLQYGLFTALEGMIDELSDRLSGEVRIEFSVAPSEVRYAPDVEESIYRIVQQAVENAVRHAQPETVQVSGTLGAEAIMLVIEDDGTGFETLDGFEINKLLARGRFGIVGLLERARLIGASVNFDSTPSNGTRVSIHANVEQK